MHLDKRNEACATQIFKRNEKKLKYAAALNNAAVL